MNLPVVLLVGIINLVAKRYNYGIHMEKNPEMDIRVKRHAIEETRTAAEVYDSNKRNSREINANSYYNWNQLNQPYTNINSNNGNQNLPNYNSDNYNNPYNGNYNYDIGNMYNPYYNVKSNANTRNFNANINYDNYLNNNNNGNARNSEINDIYKNNNGKSNNYRPDNINISDSRSNNGDYVNNNLNKTETTTPTIVEGRIFNFGCPKGKKRVGWICVKG